MEWKKFQVRKRKYIFVLNWSSCYFLYRSLYDILTAPKFIINWDKNVAKAAIKIP